MEEAEKELRPLYEAVSFLVHYPLVAVNQGRQALYVGDDQPDQWYDSQLEDGIYLFPVGASIEQ